MVEPWIALEDMAELYPEDAPVWFCDPNTGITDELVERILAHGVPPSQQQPYSPSWYDRLRKLFRNSVR